MRITLSGAMRARDVSRPTDEQLEEAAEREARITRVGRPSGASAAGGSGSAAAVAAVVGGAERARRGAGGGCANGPAGCAVSRRGGCSAALSECVTLKGLRAVRTA